MAEFKVTDFVHLGIDAGVEACEWELALDEDFTQIITNKITSSEENCLEKFTLRYNMRIYKITIDGVEYDFTDYNNGTGLYWNGHTRLWVRVRFIIRDVPQQWYSKSWLYQPVADDGTPYTLTNPLGFTPEELEYYRSETKDPRYIPTP